MMVGINFTIIPAFSLLPLMVKDYFGGSAIHLSWVESAMGAGMIFGGALLGLWGGFSRKILTSLVGLIGMGAGTLILALAPSSAIFLAVGGALLVGLMTPMTMGPFFAIIQSTVEPDKQARIFSLLSSVGTGIAPLGLMIAGPVADRFGIQAWFLLGGILCIFMAVTGLFIPAVMNMEKKGDPLPEAVGDSVRQAI
jgi:DHA3 family macrolide efflux protein-like MFS transporter